MIKKLRECGGPGPLGGSFANKNYFKVEIKCNKFKLVTKIVSKIKKK
jgi:hypothetical protein